MMFLVEDRGPWFVHHMADLVLLSWDRRYLSIVLRTHATLWSYNRTKFR